MVVSSVCALRWITGTWLRTWVALPIGVLGVSSLAFGHLITLLWLGYWPEVAAIGEFALLVAVLVRPLPRIREQVLLLVALVVAICFTYFLMLPTVAVGLAGWLWVYRRRLRGHWRFTIVSRLLGAGLASIMGYVNALAPPLAEHVAQGGTILHPDKRDPIVFTPPALALAGAAPRPSA